MTVLYRLWGNPPPISIHSSETSWEISLCSRYCRFSSLPLGCRHIGSSREYLGMILKPVTKPVGFSSTLPLGGEKDTGAEGHCHRLSRQCFYLFELRRFIGLFIWQKCWVPHLCKSQWFSWCRKSVPKILDCRTLTLYLLPGRRLFEGQKGSVLSVPLKSPRLVEREAWTWESGEQRQPCFHSDTLCSWRVDGRHSVASGYQTLEGNSGWTWQFAQGEPRKVPVKLFWRREVMSGGSLGRWKQDILSSQAWRWLVASASSFRN